ncbi:hypothetical protein HZU77_016020 [Neisseriaceae bacterium TC5R-5]|nr:hypothetical protein [Neisseriaceae bacterium TC5R-5]
MVDIRNRLNVEIQLAKFSADYKMLGAGDSILRGVGTGCGTGRA